MRPYQTLMRPYKTRMRPQSDPYEHCKCSLAAILVLHDDVINSYPYNVIQVIGCNRYSTVGVEMTSIGTLVPEI